MTSADTATVKGLAGRINSSYPAAAAGGPLLRPEQPVRAARAARARAQRDHLAAADQPLLQRHRDPARVRQRHRGGQPERAAGADGHLDRGARPGGRGDLAAACRPVRGADRGAVRARRADRPHRGAVEPGERAVLLPEGGRQPALLRPAAPGLSPQLSEAQQFNDVVAGPDVDAALAIELDAVVSGQSLTGRRPQAWLQRHVASRSARCGACSATTWPRPPTQAATLQQGAQSSERLTGIVVLVLLLLVLVITVVMARSMIMPLRRLRADALDVAGRRLPDMVRRLSPRATEAGRERPARAHRHRLDRRDRRGGPRVRPGAQRGRHGSRATRPCCGRT